MVVKALLSAKAMPSAMDRYGATSLQWALHSGQEEVAKLLEKEAKKTGPKRQAGKELGDRHPIHTMGYSKSGVSKLTDDPR